MALLAVAAIAGCGKSAPQPDANAIAADNNAAGPTSFDTLPADESSTTPSNQLVNGFDNPDVNDTTTANSD
jgi:hypothetical protein